MPLLITPPAPLFTSAQTAQVTIYAIIDKVSYRRRGLYPKRIVATVGYYANESASLTAELLTIPNLVAEFEQEATPEQADTLPIFQFLESLLRQRLAAVLPAGTTIATVA